MCFLYHILDPYIHHVLCLGHFPTGLFILVLELYFLIVIASLCFNILQLGFSPSILFSELLTLTQTFIHLDELLNSFATIFKAQWYLEYNYSKPVNYYELTSLYL